ncbi:MAG: glycosyl transferase family 51, partial [Proteobacteria bacterium]
MKRFPNRLTLILALALFGAAAVIALAVELKTSRLQAHFLGTISQRLSFEVLPGASDAIYFPQFGPYDQRLGYTKIPAVSKALAEAGFKIAHQARQSQAMLKLRDFGLYPIYKEKTRAGLEIRDRLGDPIYSVLRPERYYTGFEEVPKVILSSILFIENREALDERYAFSNPAVEWDRFLRAIMENAYEKINPKHQAPGGSTIATQLEKYRHSRGGRTRSAKDKLVQMAAAGLRAYQGGEDTIQSRKGIVLTYINSIPLAALPGYGEVNGLGDGLWAWYGRELREVNSLLSRDLKSQAAAPELFEGQARAFKQVLSLFVAHRRPTYYLLKGNQALEVLTNEYLDRLRKAGIIGDEFCRLTKKQELNTRKAAPEAAPISFVLRKAANAIRTKLLSITKIPQLYDLDQLDLVVESTIDKTIHDAVTSTLDSLRTRKEAEKLGLLGGRTLGRGDPAKVIYSFTLYEHVDGANLLRVQTDNLDRPFDINEGTRLDLGSTAKLRTLVTYLEVIEEIYSALQPIDKNDRSNSLGIKPDPLTIWVAGYLKENPDAQLKEVLEASMQRRYSASPAERFFTGGGLHTFENFKREDDVKNPSVREAIRDSINLPFVRLMRDVSRYYRAKVSGEGIRTSSTTGSAAEAGRKKRQEYIARFADKEGSEFVREFYARYSGGSSSEILQLFLSRFHLTSNKAAIIFRHIFPNKDQGELADFIKRHAVSSNLNERSLERLFERYHPEKLSLNDKGYLLRIHPLELWLVGHLYHAPDATFEEVLEAGQEERQEAYQWLFNPPQERAQDLRINILMEADAFEEI